MALPEGFRVWREDHGGEVVVRVEGEVDMNTAPALWELLGQALGTNGADPVVLDLSAMSFIDSQGIKTLLRAYRRAQHQADRLVLRSPQPQARKVLEITGLDKVLRIEG